MKSALDTSFSIQLASLSTDLICSCLCTSIMASTQLIEDSDYIGFRDGNMQNGLQCWHYSEEDHLLVSLFPALINMQKLPNLRSNEQKKCWKEKGLRRETSKLSHGKIALSLQSIAKYCQMDTSLFSKSWLAFLCFTPNVNQRNAWTQSMMSFFKISASVLTWGFCTCTLTRAYMTQRAFKFKNLLSNFISEGHKPKLKN